MLTFCDKHGHKAVEEAVKDNAGIKLDNENRRQPQTVKSISTARAIV